MPCALHAEPRDAQLAAIAAHRLDGPIAALATESLWRVASRWCGQCTRYPSRSRQCSRLQSHRSRSGSASCSREPRTAYCRRPLAEIAGDVVPAVVQPLASAPDVIAFDPRREE